MNPTPLTKQPKQRLIVSPSSARSTTLVLVALLFLLVFVGAVENWFGVIDKLNANAGLQAFLWSFAHADAILLVVLFLPVVGGFAQLAFGMRHVKWRDRMVIGATFLNLALSLLMYPNAIDGGIRLMFPQALGLGLSFTLDMLGYTMVLITNIVWLFVMVFTHVYMGPEKRSTRFYFFMAITYTTVLGAVMAGDLFTMYLFFEIMTVASYLLVVHYQQDESNRAAATYIFMGLIGGFLILVAMLLLYFEVGDLSFESALGALNQTGSLRFWIIGLLIFGFGVKAGMVPVHIWLPKAHPVAPTPASALLSGILIKVGAYGILRVATSYYFPISDVEPDAVWLTIEAVGFLVIWAGIITMTVGVFMALQQSHIKRMLAYHSVSQMGYIITGVGIAMYLGDHGAVGYAGAVYHIVNHALFKSLLFLVAGVVYHHTHETDMYKLGGLWKKLPVTTFVALIAALGISGIPLFNGFISKSILHHGIVEAVHEGSWIFTLAEWIFIIVSAGTVASFLKMMYYVFFKKTTETYRQIGFEWDGMNAAMIGLAGLISVIGLAPNFLMKRFLLPQIEAMSFDPHFVEEALSHMNYYNGSDLITMVGVVCLGAGIFYVGKKYHLFHLHLPKWLSVEYLILYPWYMLMYRSCKIIDRKKHPLDEQTAQMLSLEGTNQVGFLERFQITVKRFNDRFEEPFIQSDALIYTGLIVLILIFVLIRIF